MHSLWYKIALSMSIRIKYIYLDWSQAQATQNVYYSSKMYAALLLSPQWSPKNLFLFLTVLNNVSAKKKIIFLWCLLVFKLSKEMWKLYHVFLTKFLEHVKLVIVIFCMFTKDYSLTFDLYSLINHHPIIEFLLFTCTF